MQAPPSGDRVGAALDDHAIPEWVRRGAVLFATLLGALTLLSPTSLRLFSRTNGALDAVEVGLVLLAVAPWWRRSWIPSTSPVVVAAVFVPPAALALMGAPPVCMGLLALATVRITVFGGFWRGLAFAAASAGVVIARATLVETTDWFMWKSYVELGLALGLAMRGSRLLVLKQREATDMLARQAAAEERERIARDVHDAIAHSLSVMMLQVNGARALIATDPGGATEALDEAITEGRRSLDEVRRVVGLLGPARVHDTVSTTAAAAPVRELVDSYRRAGLDAELEVHANDVALLSARPEIGAVAYRIVQESLANAVKHAPGAPARVAITTADGGLSVRITNPMGASGPGGSDSGGHGLKGMRERVEQLGGAFSGGPSNGRRWVILCHLPLRPPAGAAAPPVAVAVP